MLLPRRRHLLVLLSDARLLLILLSVSRVGRGAWTGRGAASSSAARAAPLCAEGNALSRAVGDVHGGKYNFDPTYSFGRDDGTSGTRIPSAAANGAGERKKKRPPKWARALSAAGEPVAGTLPLAPGGEAAFDVVNDEPTWEKFFAAVLVDGGNAEAAGLSVAPERGTLAPRGGASNVCDANKPYADAQRFVVTRAAPGGAPLGAAHVVVKTEEAQWTFEIADAPSEGAG